MNSKKIFIGGLSLLLLIGIVSCKKDDPKPSSSSSSSNPTSETSSSLEESSSELSVDVNTSVVEDKKDVPFPKKEYAAWHDYVSEFKFDENSGRKWIKIESTKSLIDGDTSHFYVSTKDLSGFPTDHLIQKDRIMKIRYLGIDTPESTGQVEEWGKTASNFNKERLSKATSIIVESNDSNWNLDSTATRYLGLVWYRTSETEDYKLLNLEIMQEGLTNPKSTGSLYCGEVFQNALNQAIEHEKYLFAKHSSPFRFNDKNDTFIESTGYVLGSTGSNKSIISFEQTRVEEINSVKLFDSEFKQITSATKLNELVASDEDKEEQEHLDYYLGIIVDGKTYYYTGNQTDGLGEVSENQEDAQSYKIEKDQSKKGYLSIYRLDDNNVHQYLTLNSVNNLDYMYRDANYYYGAYIETTLKGLRTYPESYVGTLVRFEGVITRVEGTSAYIQENDEETGLTYGVYIFMGYNFSGSSLMKVGNRLSVCGTYQFYEEGGTYQIAGLTYMVMKPNYEKNLKLISTDNEFTVKEITAANLNDTTASDLYEGISYAETLMNTAVTMKNLTVTKVYTTTAETSSSKGAMTLTCSDASGSVCTVRTEVIYKSEGVLATEDDFKNKNINIKGIVDKFNDSYQVRVFNYNDVEFN